MGARVAVGGGGRVLDLGSVRGRDAQPHVFAEPAEEARALLDAHAHLMAVPLGTMLDASLFLELGVGAELDDGLGAVHGLEVDLSGRDAKVQEKRPWCVERLAPHRLLRGRAIFAGRRSTLISTCPKGVG